MLCDSDAELVEAVIVKMHPGKAAGLRGLTVEHLQYSHPLLPCDLAELFNLMIKLGRASKALLIHIYCTNTYEKERV